MAGERSGFTWRIGARGLAYPLWLFDSHRVGRFVLSPVRNPAVNLDFDAVRWQGRSQIQATYPLETFGLQWIFSSSLRSFSAFRRLADSCFPSTSPLDWRHSAILPLSAIHGHLHSRHSHSA